MGMVVNGSHDLLLAENGRNDAEKSGKQPDADHIKMFVGQIPRNYVEEDIRQIFEEFGEIHTINILKDKLTGAGKGCCFVTFYMRKSALDAQNALHNIRTLPGMHNPIQMKPADTENRTERKLFVGMISKKATEDDIRRIFLPYGPVEECTILRDSNGSSRGCCFVTLSSRSNAVNAIRALHHSTTSEGCTSPVVVKMADTTKDKDSKKQTLPLNSAFVGQLGQLGQLSQLGYYNLLQPTSTLNLATLLAAAQQAGLTGFNLTGSSQLTSSGLSPGLLNSLTGANIHNGGSTASSLSNFASGGSLNGLFGGNSNLNTLCLQDALQNQQQQQMVQRLLEGSGHNTLSSSAYGNSSSSLSNSPYSGNIVSSSYDPRGLSQLSLLQAMNTPSNSLSANRQSEEPSDDNPAQSDIAGPDGCNLFIYHLPAEYTDSELIQLFSSFGNLISAKVFIDKQTGLSKCFGFVSYSQQSSAQQAISTMNGFQIGMKRLKVQLKRSRDSKPY